MAQKPLIKREITYQIYTTDELEALIYFAKKIRIKGSFVKFKPFQCVSKYKEPADVTNEILILPERVITKISVMRTRVVKPS